MINLLKNLPKLFQSEVPHSDSIDRKILADYYRSRQITDKTYLCHAPFNNMYFNSVGDVANCWLTFEDPERYSEEKTLKEIWFGEKFSKLRQHIRECNLDYRCSTCKHNLETGNFVNVLAKAYDNPYALSDFPTMMEFELTNTCNLECTMCTGLLSSSIRQNRDKLPPLKSPYGDKFVQEFKEFIPHLHEARFNGGEPFLIKIYAQMWDLILDIKPSIKVVIATNGTVLNSRVKDYLQRGNFHINLSIDGMSKETYEQIRINADLDQVLENFQYFRTFCQQNNRNICVMINPMRQNWWEMPTFLNFCNENNVHLWFNTIMRPLDQSLWNLPYAQLKEIYEQLSTTTIHPNKNTSKGIYNYNVTTYNNLVHQQIHTWMLEAKERESTATSLTIEADEKVLFNTRLKEYLRDENLAEDTVADKLAAIKEDMKTEVTELQFYKILNSAAIDIVVNNLREYDVPTLKERLREALKLTA